MRFTPSGLSDFNHGDTEEQRTGIQGAGIQGAGIQGAGIQGTDTQGAGNQGTSALGRCVCSDRGLNKNTTLLFPFIAHFSLSGGLDYAAVIEQFNNPHIHRTVLQEFSQITAQH